MIILLICLISILTFFIHKRHKEKVSISVINKKITTNFNLLSNNDSIFDIYKKIGRGKLIIEKNFPLPYPQKTYIWIYTTEKHNPGYITITFENNKILSKQLKLISK